MNNDENGREARIPKPNLNSNGGNNDNDNNKDQNGNNQNNRDNNQNVQNGAGNDEASDNISAGDASSALHDVSNPLKKGQKENERRFDKAHGKNSKADKNRKNKNKKKASSQGKNNPLKNAAKRLAKKGVKKTVKAGTPALAGLYAGGKLFDMLREKMGLLIGQASSMMRDALVNSPVGHALNLVHNAIAATGNAIHGIASGIGHMAGGIANTAGHVAGAIGHFASGVVHTGTSMVMSGVHAVSSSLGVSTVQAAAISTVMPAVAVGSVVFGLTSTFFNPGTREGSEPESCLALVDGAQEGASVNTNTSKKADDIAKSIWSAFKIYGLNDDQIAGILGCWQRESHGDPTSVEGIFDEPYTMGKHKKEALHNLSAYTSKVSTGSSQYTSGGACPGIGLGQWTGGNGIKLMAAAKKTNHNWYDLDFQVAYVLATPTPTGMSAKSFWSGLKHTNSSNAAVQYFLTHWEGVPGNALSEREGYANGFKRKMKSWKVNSKAGNSILKLAKNLGAHATEKAVQDAAQSCADAQKKINGDNSNLVNAALSYAWDNEKEATGNNGTQLYQKVHRGIFPGDPFFMSCDRNVASAVRWSGTDVTYPPGDTGRQLQYLASSKKWKKIGSTDHFDYKKLRPGDVMCKNGHTYLYVGNEAVKNSIKHGQHKASKVPSQADSVDASYMERSAGIGVEARYSIIEHGDGPYDIYRCIKPDHSSRYKSIGVHMK